MVDVTLAQRLGRTTNLVIFLGLLYTVVHLLALAGVLAPRQYGVLGLGIALGVTGLGYGIRYGSLGCFYGATGVFTALSLYFLVCLVVATTPSVALRWALSSWVAWRLWQAIPAMRLLRQARAFPLPMSRYGAFVLRRFTKRSGREEM